MLGSTYSVDLKTSVPSAPADSFPLCDAGVRTWASLAQARPGWSSLLADPRLASRLFYIGYKMGSLGSQTHCEQWGTISSDRDLSGAPRSILFLVPFCTLSLSLPT